MAPFTVGSSDPTQPVQPPGSAAAGSRESWRASLRTRETGLALLVLAAAAGLAVAQPRFLSASNLLSLGTGMIYDLPVAAGVTLVMILGGIDLSVGAVLGLTGVVTAMCLRSGVPVPLSILAGVVTAGGAGAFNGLLVARLRLAPFIVTLGTMSVARGTATVLTSGYFLSALPAAYVAIGRGQLFGVPYPIFVVVGVLAAFHVLLKRWRPLHEAFYVGHNPAAAALSGIAVRRLVFAGYVTSALLAGLSALFMTARLAMGTRGSARWRNCARLRRPSWGERASAAARAASSAPRWACCCSR